MSNSLPELDVFAIKDEIIMADNWGQRCSECESQHIRKTNLYVDKFSAHISYLPAFKILTSQCVDCDFIKVEVVK